MNDRVNSQAPCKNDISATVSAPGRLHCGLFAVGDQTARRFGGLGIMVREPRTEISIRPSSGLQIIATGSGMDRENGPGVERAVGQTVDHWLGQYRSQLSSERNVHAATANELNIEIRIDRVPARHSGFGSGTQLAFATAAALFRMFGLPMPGPAELAPVLHRGMRSAIGTFGFYEGGLLVDRGNTAEEPLAPLDFHVDFPGHWPIVIATPGNAIGLSGWKERAAFSRISPTTCSTQQESIDLVNKEIVPAVVSADYQRFAPAIYELGFRSGMCFQEVQGGLYNGPEIESLVEFIRETGIQATGQSSWGPAVFAVVDDEHVAEELSAAIEKRFDDCDVFVTRADNTGMRSSK